jgi:hypothetical protein
MSLAGVPSVLFWFVRSEMQWPMFFTSFQLVLSFASFGRQLASPPLQPSHDALLFFFPSLMELTVAYTALLMFIRSVYWCFSFGPSFDSALIYSNLLVLSLFFVPYVMNLHCFPSFSGLLRQLLLSSFPTLFWQLLTALSPCRVTGFPALPALRHPRPDVWLICAQHVDPCLPALLPFQLPCQSVTCCSF